MSDTHERVLPQPWQITAADLQKLCGQPVPRRGSDVLVTDVEGLCRGALADAQRRGAISRDLETRDWREVLGFLFGEVVVVARGYDPGRRGIEFRPWLYERLRLRAVDGTRWLYGRQGQHRVNGYHPLTLEDDDDDWNVDQPDPVDDSREARLEEALSGGAVDGPEHRLDDLFGLESGGYRELLRGIPGLGGEADRRPAQGDRPAGRVNGNQPQEEVAA